jgi:hypothetical protein
MHMNHLHEIKEIYFQFENNPDLGWKIMHCYPGIIESGYPLNINKQWIHCLSHKYGCVLFRCSPDRDENIICDFNDFYRTFKPSTLMECAMIINLYNKSSWIGGGWRSILNMINKFAEPRKNANRHEKVINKILGESRGALIWCCQLEMILNLYFDYYYIKPMVQSFNANDPEGTQEISRIFVRGRKTLLDVLKERKIIGGAQRPDMAGAFVMTRIEGKI